MNQYLITTHLNGAVHIQVVRNYLQIFQHKIRKLFA